MILENFNDTSYPASFSSTIGDPTELVEATVEFMSEAHNLTVALARFEHRAIMESAGDITQASALMEGAVKEFFVRMKDGIVKYWKKFMAWISFTYQRLKSTIFAPRRQWLKDNLAEIEGMSNFPDDAKVSVGKNLPGNYFHGLFAASTALITQAGSYAVKSSSGVDQTAFNDEVKKILLDGQTTDDNYAVSLNKTMIGDSEDVKMKDVKAKLINVANSTFDNVDKMPALTHVGNALISEASAAAIEAGVKASSDEERTDQATKIKNISSASTAITSYIGALVSVNTRANAQAMSALLKILHAGRQNKLSGSKAKNESTYTLDSFM
jgi:hypothetical protein